MHPSRFLLIALVALVAALGCKNSAKSGGGKGTGSSAANDSIYRLSVSFISIGSGIDAQAQAKYDQFVTEFGTRHKVTLAHETVGWGREGEVDYCFKLSELKSPQQATFVEESKALLAGNELVLFKENTPCRKPRR